VADVKFALGRSLERGGELGPAAEAYREVLLKDPSRADACWRLAVLCDREAKFRESQDWYRKALAGMPGNAEIYCDVGYSLYLQQRWEEAEMNLRQALALAPDHARAHNNLGLVLAHIGKTDEALVEFRRAGCGEADGHVNLAYVLLLNKSWKEARRHYELALAADGSSAPARTGLREVEVLAARTSPQTIIQTHWDEPQADSPQNADTTGR